MPTIRTHVTEGDYQKLVAQRKHAGLPSVSALFLEKCNILDDAIEAQEICRKAHQFAEKKDDNVRFRLRDLFKATEWDSFSKGARLRAGRLFNSKVAAATDGIRLDKQSGSGHQFYIKTPKKKAKTKP